jgi:DNA-binding NarL/FixJ family response regulator
MEEPGIAAAVAALRASTPGSMTTAAGAQVMSEQLQAGFAPSPGGRITFVTRRAAAPSSLDFGEVLEQLFGGQLTPREIAICGLVLRGFPSASVAERLEIAVGTVKNHRKSIYRKLDITTERELFLMLFDYLNGQAAQNPSAPGR